MNRIPRVLGAVAMTGVAVALCTYAETTPGRAVVAAFAIIATSAYATWFLYREDLTMEEQATSPTDAGKLRRASDRLIELGVLTACVPDDPDRPRSYSLITAAGDQVTVRRRDMPAMLRGIQLGHYAATTRPAARSAV